MKAILVIDIPNDLSLSDLYISGGLWEAGQEDGWAYEFQAEDIKPMPKKRPVHYNDEIFGEVENLTNMGWNDCLEEIGGN